MRKQAIISGVVLALLSLAVFAGAAYLLRGSEEGDSAANPVSASPATTRETEENTVQADVPPRPACPTGPVAGVDLPCLGAGDDAATDAGDKAAAADKGVTVVNVWAWWCGPCREELPAMDEVARNHPEWTVVGVQADKNAAAGAGMLNDLGVEIPSFQDDDNSFASKLGLPRVVPVTVVLRHGKVIATVAQPFTDAGDITDAVEQALAE